MTVELPQVVVTERLTLVRREGATPPIEFQIDTTANRASIGMGSLAPREDGDWRVHLSLEEAARGVGFGREAGRALLSLAFAELGATRVVVEVALENERGTRLAEHLGMNGQGVEDGARLYITWRPPGVDPPRRRKR